MQRQTRRKGKPSLGPNRYQVLLLISLIGLFFVTSTMFTEWPYEMAKSLGLEAKTGIDNILQMLQIPGFVLFLLLTIYGIKRCIDEYQRSFESNTGGGLGRREPTRMRRRMPYHL